MIQIDMTVETLEFDFQTFNEKLLEAIGKQMRNAARAFVRAAIRNVPVWSGMSRGTYLPLGRFLRVAIPINPRAGVLDKRDVGERLTMYSAQDSFVRNGNVFSFRFGHFVKHYMYQEFFRGPSQTSPWKSYAAGRAAFLRYWEDIGINRLPTIYEFMIVSTVQVTGNRVITRKKPFYNIRKKRVGEEIDE